MDRYRKTFETWDKMAQAYQDRFMELDLYNDTYDRLCSMLQGESPRLLEIGCGPGNITRYLLARRPDIVIEAIDVSPNMIKLAAANNPRASFTVMDGRDIDKLMSGYDAVVCGFCMPYLSQEDCIKLFKDIAALLEDGGIFYGSTIEGSYSRSGYEAGSSGHEAYVYYHDESFICGLLEENNFGQPEFIRKPYRRSNGMEETHLVFITKRL